MEQLQIGSTLQNGKYRIVRVLGQGGFGITYEGEQTALGRRVAIKEFFMKECCERNGLTVTAVGTQGTREQVSLYREKFIKEAQLIASLDQAPHVVRIYDIFEENHTAYYVMEYIEGGSLVDLVRREGSFNEARTVALAIQCTEALGTLHQRQTMHLDVKPSNILVREDRQGNDDVVLIDFGVSKHYNCEGQQTTSTPVGLSKGFAPLEQYREGGVSEFSPATDVYSLGATLYYLRTGVVPPEAADLLSAPLSRPSGVSVALWQVIARAMSIRPADRYQSMGEMAQALRLVSVTSFDKNESVTMRKIEVSESVKTKIASVETVVAKKSLTRYWPWLAGLPLLVLLLMWWSNTWPVSCKTSSVQESAETDISKNIVFAIDVSTSMLAVQLQHTTHEGNRINNRIEAVSYQTKTFIEHCSLNDSIGLVTFAGEAWVRCNRTANHDNLCSLANFSVVVDSVSKGFYEEGTAIGDGLACALGIQPDSSAVVLITDGSNNRGNYSPVAAADLAKQRGIRVYVICIYSQEPVPYPLPVGDSIQHILVPFESDMQTCNQIAEITGGICYRASDYESLVAAFDAISQIIL